MYRLPAAVHGLLDAVNTRDAAALGPHPTPDDIAYHLIVPQDPVIGRGAVAAVLAQELDQADRVRSHVTASATNGGLAFLERIDGFWFGENEAAIESLGVMGIEDGAITEIRDYAGCGRDRLVDSLIVARGFCAVRPLCGAAEQRGHSLPATDAHRHDAQL